VAIRLLGRLRDAARVRHDTVAVVEVERADAWVRVAWSRVPAPQTVILARRGSLRLAVDGLGRPVPVEGLPTGYRVLLPGARCAQRLGGACMIGGMPVYIVESVPPSARLPR
jgi:hypothetical protein